MAGGNKGGKRGPSKKGNDQEAQLQSLDDELERYLAQGNGQHVTGAEVTPQGPSTTEDVADIGAQQAEEFIRRFGLRSDEGGERLSSPSLTLLETASSPDDQARERGETPPSVLAEKAAIADLEDALGLLDEKVLGSTGNRKVDFTPLRRLSKAEIKKLQNLVIEIDKSMSHSVRNRFLKKKFGSEYKYNRSMMKPNTFFWASSPERLRDLDNEDIPWYQRVESWLSTIIDKLRLHVVIEQKKYYAIAAQFFTCSGKGSEGKGKDFHGSHLRVFQNGLQNNYPCDAEYPEKPLFVKDFEVAEGEMLSMQLVRIYYDDYVSIEAGGFTESSMIDLALHSIRYTAMNWNGFLKSNKVSFNTIIRQMQREQTRKQQMAHDDPRQRELTGLDSLCDTGVHSRVMSWKLGWDATDGQDRTDPWHAVQDIAGRAQADILRIEMECAASIGKVENKALEKEREVRRVHQQQIDGQQEVMRLMMAQAETSHHQELADVDAKHQEDVEALKAERDFWKHRAGALGPNDGHSESPPEEGRGAADAGDRSSAFADADTSGKRKHGEMSCDTGPDCEDSDTQRSSKKAKSGGRAEDVGEFDDFDEEGEDPEPFSSSREGGKPAADAEFDASAEGNLGGSGHEAGRGSNHTMSVLGSNLRGKATLGQ